MIPFFDTRILKLFGYFFIQVIIFILFFIFKSYNYNVYHFFAEGFCIAVGLCIYFLTINSRKHFKNNFLIFISLGFLSTIFIDSFHVLAYRGMNIFEGYDTNLPTQLWIFSRYIFGITMLIAIILFERKIKIKVFTAIYFIGTVTGLFLIFNKQFPTCFIEGYGLTPFKIISEYIIVVIIIISLLFLWKKKDKFDNNIYKNIFLSSIFTILSEIMFTGYSDPYNIFNMLGHYFKIIAVYFIYKAIIETVIKYPQKIIFSEIELKKQELESEVKNNTLKLEERNLELIQANEKLKQEVMMHQRAKESLAVKEQELKSLVNNSADIIVRFDKNLKYVFANDQAADSVGLLKEEMIGKTNIELDMPESNVSNLHIILKDIFNKGNTRRFESQYLTPNGERHLNTIAVPELNDQGQVKTVLCIGRDITDRIQSQRLIQLNQQKIMKAEKDKVEALKNAIEMKDEFLSIISHELRTPLTVIISAIQTMDMLCKNEMSNRVKSYIGKIKINTLRQLKLVNNLLEITRLKSGFIKINRKNLDIVSLTDRIIQSILLYAQQKDIQLIFSSTFKKKVIYIDEEKYERILLNLLSNAIKFTPKGKSIIVKISSKKGYIYLSVKDEGIGIPKDKQKLIFERFGQVDSSLSRQAEGSGIGLSLVKMYVEALCGSISVHSKEGIGSKFLVVFPNDIEDDMEEKTLEEFTENRLIWLKELEFSDVYL